MRSQPRTLQTVRTVPLHGNRRARHTILVTIFGCLAALALPGAALADTLSLAAPEATQELASQVSFTATSEEPVYTVIALNNPGVPCAPDPTEDNGTTITPTHLLEGGASGTFSAEADYTAPSAGTYTACGWLEIPLGFIERDGGPVTASASTPIIVRAPHIELSLSFPTTPAPDTRFTLDLTASSEVNRQVVVIGIPYTRSGCPTDYAQSSAQHVIEAQISGGPWLRRTTIDPLRAGTYIFCAWADPPNDGGLYPQASTSIVLALGAHPKSKAAPGRHRSHRRTERPATPAQFDAINRMFKDTERTLHVELEWVNVSTQGPFALAYLQGGQDTAALLGGAGTRWRSLATISDEGLRCGLVPPSIIAGLDLERYNEGPRATRCRTH